MRQASSIKPLVKLWRNDAISSVREAAYEALNALRNQVSGDGADDCNAEIEVTRHLVTEIDGLRALSAAADKTTSLSA
jgi:hypothetical protein